MTEYLLAIDQGTTGSTAVVMDGAGSVLGRANVEFAQHYPEPGWVEHDPEEIWASVQQAVSEALRSASVAPQRLRGIGIATQRETALVWERGNGRPVHPAIVWQCRRTEPICAALRKAGREELIERRTGLVLDPYFSATKVSWILQHIDRGGARARAGELAFGTVDSFLVHRLTGGREHVTDVSNASRTLLMDLERQEWDDELCSLFGVPRSMLPRIVESAGAIGVTRHAGVLPDGLAIAGMAGDQQAALFGQGCMEPGDTKCTYGTGAFVLVNTGAKRVHSRVGVLSTVAWSIGGRVTYAAEGSSFVAGAAVQWLRDGLGVIRTAAEVEALARQVSSSEGVVFVPALVGLGAPYWDAQARGLICGLTRGSTAAHLARATLEGIAHQVTDLLGAMNDALGQPIRRLRVDGGAAGNDLLLQMQADLAGVTVERPRELESTARGAGMLAAVGVGLYESERQVAGLVQLDRSFQVQVSAEQRHEARRAWSQAIDRARSVST